MRKPIREMSERVCVGGGRVRNSPHKAPICLATHIVCWDAAFVPKVKEGANFKETNRLDGHTLQYKVGEYDIIESYT